MPGRWGEVLYDGEMTRKLKKADKPVGKLTKLWADLVSIEILGPFHME